LIPASGDRDHTLLPSAGRIPRQMMQARVHRTPPDVRDDAYALRSGRDKADETTYF